MIASLCRFFKRTILVHVSSMIVLLTLSILPEAYAGRHCEIQPQKRSSFIVQMANAARLDDMLDASGATVVILARAGQDLSGYHLKYSHVAFAYMKPSGAWEVVHKLNHCNSDEAGVFRQGLLEFLGDDLWNQEVAWMEPPAAVQANLLAVLHDDQKIQLMHEKKYNMMAYAWGLKYQQSNQWLLETYALAADPSISSRAQAQNWLRNAQYEPDGVQVGIFARNLADWTRVNIALDDHPSRFLRVDQLYTVTADSIFAWLQNKQQGGELYYAQFKE